MLCKLEDSCAQEQGRASTVLLKALAEYASISLEILDLI